MLLSRKLSMLTAGVLGFCSVLNAQVLDRDLLKENAKHFEIQQTTNTVKFIQFREGNAISGRDFFSTFLNTSNNPTLRFDLVQEETDRLGYTHYRYQEFVGDIKVEGGEFVVSSNAKGLSFASGKLLAFDNVLPVPSIDPVGAVQIAQAVIGADTYKWEVPTEELFIKQLMGDPMATFFPTPEVVAVMNANGTIRLAYKMDIYAHAPMSRDYVYLDANTGELIKKHNRIHASNENGSGITLYNGTQNFTTDSHNGTFRLYENVPVNGVQRKIHTHDMNTGTNYNNAVDFTDSDNHFTDNTNKDRAGWSAHWGAEATWDYFYYEMGRNSYDNNGATINSYVHYDNNFNNAFWDGSRMTYGDGDGSSFDPLVGLDVVGHEIAHAVTERTSGLVYQNESGALNESFSDIFGTAIEFYKEGAAGDWLIGEDFDVQNGIGFRNMENPNAQGDPDTYQGSNWKSLSAFPNQLDDYGGVHSNSGVQNFWFYVLTVGKSGTNDNGDAYSVQGIGIQKAAAIAYRNNATKLTSNSDYADARAGAIASAIELYGENSQEVISTTNAWYAVGVGAEHPGGGPATCNVPTGLFASSVDQFSASLNWSNVGAASNFNVRYRESGTTAWTNQTVVATSLNISGLTASTSYEFQVQSDCGGGETSAYSASQNFTTTNGGGTPVTYCTSQGNSTSDEWIARIQLAGLDNNSGNNSGYADFTSTVVQLTAGSSYNFTLTPGFSGGGVFGPSSYPEYWRIWIDYNADGDFTDAGEMAYDAGGTSTSAVSGALNIPSSANGTTRMRIQMKYNGAPTSCESFGYGEVEDYTVNIQPNTPPSCDAPENLSSNNLTHNSADLAWEIAAAAQAYIVQYRVQGNGAWTSLNVASNSASISGLQANSTYEWNVKSDCGSEESTVSVNATFSTQAEPVCGETNNLAANGVTSSSVNLSWSAGDNVATYEVRYRAVGGAWTSASTSSNAMSLTGLSAETSYNWEVKTICSFGESSVVSGPNFTTLENTPPPANYCQSQGNSTADEWIASIAVGSLNNTSGNNGGYADFTSTVFTAAAGSNQSLTLSPGFASGGLFGSSSYPEYWRIWIDYNQDGDFNDAGELAFDAGGTSTSTVTGSFNVSASALLGETRMRVSMKYNGAPSPCESFGYGEVEDYTINIIAGSAFAFNDNGGSDSAMEETVLTPSKLAVYPNPTQDVLHIVSDASGTLEVYDMSGALVMNSNLNTQTRLHLGQLAKGMYILHLNMGSKTEIKKVVVQ